VVLLLKDGNHARDGRLASMMHEGPDGEHVRAYEARPTLEEHCRPVRADRLCASPMGQDVGALRH